MLKASLLIEEFISFNNSQKYIIITYYRVIMKSVTIISALALLLILFLYFHFNRPNLSIQKLRNQLINKRKEHFTNNDKGMIKNGSFQFSDHPEQFVEKSGENEITKIYNPGNSSFALKQTGGKAYYKLNVPIKPGKKYELSYWIGKTRNWNGNDKNFNIKFGKRVISGNGTLIGTKHIDHCLWKHYRYIFKTEKSDPNLISIYLGYKPSATKGERYFTDIQMLPMVADDQSFPFDLRSGLETYINVAHPQSGITGGAGRVMKDLSTQGNDMTWKNKPRVDGDHVYTRGNMLSGRIIYGQVKDFTISIVLKPNNTNSKYENEIAQLVHIPGNQGNAIILSVSNDLTSISAIIGSKTITYNNKLSQEKSVLSLVYGDGRVTLFQNGTKLISRSGMDKLHFNGKIMINDNKMNLDMKLYAVLLFNRKLSSTQLSELYDFFNTYVAKRSGDNIYNYQMNNDVPGDIDNAIYKLDNDVSAILGMEENLFIQDFDDRAQRGIKNSWHERGNRNLNMSMDECLAEYADEIKRQQRGSDPIKVSELRSCKKACKVKENEKEFLCQQVEKEIYSEKKCKDNECPEAYLSGDRYMVYIRPGTKYAKKLKRSGNFNYGENKRRAREIYLHNFPGCPLPEILTPYGYYPDMKECPFIIDDMNPCKEEACSKAKWNEKNPAKQNLSKKCRRKISNYCDRFKYHDDACICWRPKYENLPRCRALRDYIDNMKDNCRIDVFNIEDHPDMKNYIKIDDIPCFNCNLEDLRK